MPEGPEVYALCIALNRIGLDSVSYGKHLFYNGMDFSFGLNGRVCFDTVSKTLTKVARGYIPGDCQPASSVSTIVQSHNNAPDWMCADQDNLREWVQSLRGSRKSIAATLLDQKSIAGVGVAWGSEILFAARIHPETPIKDTNPEDLTRALIQTRNQIRDHYSDFVHSLSMSELIQFVNEWFQNLYSIRKMRAYKKGLPIVVAGRQWWIIE